MAVRTFPIVFVIKVVIAVASNEFITEKVLVRFVSPESCDPPKFEIISPVPKGIQVPIWLKIVASNPRKLSIF